MKKTRSCMKLDPKRYGTLAYAVVLFLVAIKYSDAQGGPPPSPPRIATIILDAPPKTPRAEQLQRVLEGRVLDATGKSLAGVVVSLKNCRTSSILSVVTGNDGSYRFVQLPKETDYQLWAAIDNKRSDTKSISSFDSSNQMKRDISIK